MYIANRPVRFDRDYAIGERIPESVIDPNMVGKLVGMGRVIHVSDSAGQAQAGAKAEAGTTAQAKAGSAPEAKYAATEATAKKAARPKAKK